MLRVNRMASESGERESLSGQGRVARETVSRGNGWPASHGQ